MSGIAQRPNGIKAGLVRPLSYAEPRVEMLTEPDVRRDVQRGVGQVTNEIAGLVVSPPEHDGTARSHAQLMSRVHDFIVTERAGLSNLSAARLTPGET